MKTGIELIAEERSRQINDLDYTATHDQVYDNQELSKAAACYLLYADAYPNRGEPPPLWPWDDEYWKPKDYLKDLVRAGALIAAEIDMLQRTKS